LFGSGGYFFRHPSLSELYGVAGALQGNAQLTPERAIKGELGVWTETGLSNFGRVRARLSHFQVLATDLIVLTENAQRSMTATNLGRAWMYGVSGSLEHKFHKIGGATLSVLWFDARNLSAVPAYHGKRLPGRPDYEARVGAFTEISRFTAWVFFSFQGPAYWDFANRKLMGATGLVDVELRWNAGRLGHLSLEARNLLDTVVCNTVEGNYHFLDNTTGFLGYPTPGRRFFLSWRVFL
jgi:outer membrane cobalamin receptor